MTVRDNVIELRKIRHADKLVERIIHAAAAEIECLREEAERLRAERDEARRRICCDESYNHKSGVTPREVAEDLGWDCFKENNS